MLRITRLADAIGRRREHIAADPLHVIAGVQDDRPSRRVDANPFHVAAIEYLQTFNPRRWQEREQIDVLMTEEPSGARVVHLARHRRVVVEAQTEVCAGQSLVVKVRVGSEIREHRLHDRKNEPLMCGDDLPEEFFVFREWPELGTAPHPPLRGTLSRRERALAISTLSHWERVARRA